jgi:hypothetical protein
MSAFTALNVNNANGTQPGRVTQAIATASQRTGVDFSYLMGQAQIESAMNPTAKAGTSSATGLYQFLDQSWLAVINNHGSEYGMDWASNAIQKTANGRYYVSDPQVRQQILDLRKHPETASVMAAELASDNRDYLEQRIGRQAEPVDLYLAHFLGAGGAAKFLGAMANSPNTAGASLFPAAARSNASIFYDRQGNARSLADIRTSFAQKLSNGAQRNGVDIATIDTSASYELPAGSKMVAPADYLRLAQQRLMQGATSTNSSSLMDVSDPEIGGAQNGTEDAGLLANIQSMTLGRNTGQTSSRSETARLAYLMLATFGR